MKAPLGEWGFFILTNKVILTMNKDNSIALSYSFGWFSMIFGSLTLSDWAVIIGMFSTIFGFVVTWFYKHLEYELKKKQIGQQDDKQKLKK